MAHRFLQTLVFWAAVAGAAFGQGASDRFYTAIRENNLPALRTLLKSADPNIHDKRGTTPLMYAMENGSVEAIRAILAAGADVNAANDFGATALMWGITDAEKVRVLLAAGADVRAKSKMGRTPLYLAAANDGSSATVKLLLDRGVNPTERDNQQSTPLLAATAANDLASIKLLLEHGADANGSNAAGMTALMNAAGNGNSKAIEMLLARGANVNAVSRLEINPSVKNGAIALGSLTALLLAAPAARPEVIKALLDAGAKVDAVDVRQMTPLMIAVATDHADARVVKLLLDRGADARRKDRDGQSAIDWARKFNSPSILREFSLQATKVQTSRVMIPASLIATRDAKFAAAKSSELLQTTAATFFKEGGCGSCHAQNITAMATSAAKLAHIPVHEGAKAADLKGSQFFLAALEQGLLQRMDAPVPEILTSIGMQLAAESAPADRATDALVYSIAALQSQAGNWHVGWVARPPMSDGDISRTAVAIRILQLYGPSGRKAEFKQRIRRAAAWLAAAEPKTTEDLNMQLLGLKWAGASGRDLQSGVRKLLGLQREDGGWGQTPNLPTDAYATGQSLYALHEIGPWTNARGARYLLETQAADGSWHVVSRAPKFQPYFESGFPYGGDQWISSAATAWATMALTYSVAPPQIAHR
jgi:ankyrin repeat protein